MRVVEPRRAVTTFLILAAISVWLPEKAFAKCSQPISSGPEPVASDCLTILRAGVGQTSCPLCVCDTNDNGSIVASDALLCLRKAVGQAVTLSCPDCEPVTTTTSLPDTTTTLPNTTTTLPETTTTTTAPDTTTTTTLPTPVECGGASFQCGDGFDNDGDGLADAADPACLGACDNSEQNYHTDQPGSAPACTQDCFWDNGTGSGNDDCRWSHKCDPLEQAPDFDPEGIACTYDPNFDVPGTTATCADLAEAQSQGCLDVCGPAVPNGCDCFGCCELPAGGGKPVWVGSRDAQGISTCDPESETDEERCRPCSIVNACFNPCETCELCAGKTELPAECGSTQVCGNGVQACGRPGQARCGTGLACVTGCCRPVPE